MRYYKKILRILSNPSSLKFYLGKLWDICRHEKMANIPRALFVALNPYLSRIEQDYPLWLQADDLLTDDDRLAISIYLKRVRYKPLISLIIPVSSDSIPHLEQTLNSIAQQHYSNWELYITHYGSEKINATALEKFKPDSRIKCISNAVNETEALNSGLDQIKGEFVGFIECKDSLSETALLCVVDALNADASADLLYMDEDKINSNGIRSQPHFKTDWNPVMFWNWNYIGRPCFYRSTKVKELRFSPAADSVKYYDFLLRFIEKTPGKKIKHIPHVLYHQFKATQTEVESTDKTAETTALLSYFKRVGLPVRLKQNNNDNSQSPWRIGFRLPTNLPKVSIIIPTRDKVELLKAVVEAILDPAKTDYPNLEIVIVDNQSQEDETFAYFEKISKEPEVELLTFDEPFNWSRINNFAASHVSAELICLLNNDVVPINKDWLTEMVSYMSAPDIGIVGAKLYFPDDRIQHAGVVLGLGGVAGHIMYCGENKPGYMSRLTTPQNYSAVTGACLLIRKNIYDQLGGCDEKLAVAYNDVDLCLRTSALGYQIIYTPYAQLHHIESASRGSDVVASKIDRYQAEIAYIIEKHGSSVFHSDPFFNPNLSLDSREFNLAFPSRANKPWKKLQGAARSAHAARKKNTMHSVSKQ